MFSPIKVRSMDRLMSYYKAQALFFCFGFKNNFKLLSALWLLLVAILELSACVNAFSLI